MSMVYFEVSTFPKLQDHINMVYSQLYVSEALNVLGYNSAGYDRELCTWFIDESEYTWLVLRWS